MITDVTYVCSKNLLISNVKNRLNTELYQY